MKHLSFTKSINQNLFITTYARTCRPDPIVVMILEGQNAILANRKLMGATNPKEAEENTIRKLYGISIDKNSVHGSDLNRQCKKRNRIFF